MAIYQDIQITVNQGLAQPDKSLYIFRGDSNIILNFKLVTPEYKLTKDNKDNLVTRFGVDNFELRLQLEKDYNRIIKGEIVENGMCSVLLTQNIIQQLRVGSYTYQITLIDANDNAIMTFPACNSKLNILDRISINAEEFVNATEAYASFCNADTAILAIADEEPEDILDSDGNYNKKVWVNGDLIMAGDLNRLEWISYLNRQLLNEHTNALSTQATHITNNTSRLNELHQEIVDARQSGSNSYSKLGDRLDAVDSQLAHKASKDSLYLNVVDFGASNEKTNEQNKQALRNAILRADEIGCGVVFVPSNICYGYKRNDISTHPNFDGVTTRIIVVDYSRGDSYNHQELGRDGAQCRYFFNTEGNEKDAQHDGNGMIVRGKWHPYIMLSNDGKDTDNRRATYFIANRGVATWGIGQGVNSVDGATDDELSHFKIMGNKINGSEGFVTCYCIDKETGMMAWNTSQPKNDFDFIFKNNNNMRLKRNTDGNISLSFETNDGKLRKILYRDDNDTLNFTDSSGKSNVFVLSDNGEGKFSNGVTGGVFNSSSRPTNCSPGTMIFDTTLKKPLWYYGGSWYDSTGQTV